MAALTSIERLPLEVLECVVGYLSPKDLSRCCTVSKAWREVFSNGTFWKKHCNIKLSVTLESTRCLVEPHFVAPRVSSNLTPVNGWRLCFLREQHYLTNLRSGRYKKEEIEFEWDDSISYNIKVEFAANDYLFLHRTSQTEVWNVAQEPNLVMTIPFKIVGLWENNFFQFYENKLIVVQCNVVQMFNICLLSKTWSFHRTFFFDKPEEFSLNITQDTDVNKMCIKECYDVNENDDAIERAICGNFFIGIITKKTPQQNKVMHVWNLNSCKKIKEENCSEYFGSHVTYIFLQTSSASQDKIVVTGEKTENKACAVYSLSKLKFLVSYQCSNLDSLLLCDGYSCLYDCPKNEILKYSLDTNVAEIVYQFDNGERLNRWHVIGDQIVISGYRVLILLNPLTKTVEIQTYSGFDLDEFEVVKNKFLALHDVEDSLREFWEYRAVDKWATNNQNSFIKLFTLPSESGTYRSTNDVCTKIVLERANKLIVLNFW